MPIKRNLTGQRFGKLIAIRDIGSKQEGKRKFRWWLCQCDCGEFAEIRAGHLTGGQTSCGCLQISHPLPKGESAFNSLYCTYQQNAKKRNRSFELNKKQFRNLTQESCSYCGSEPSGIIEKKRQNGIYVYNGIDRIDNTKGYTSDNCVSCCKMCNLMKRGLTVKEFLDHVKKITMSSII